jgi:hypothetical protein
VILLHIDTLLTIRLLIRRILNRGMRIAIKYGAVIALGVAVWALADHYLLHLSRPDSKAAFLTPVLFNLLQLVVLFLGIRAWRHENRDQLTVRQGVWRGLAISLAYGVLACIFFLAFYLIVGSKVLENESGTFGADRPEKYVLLGAFAGLFSTALIGGLIYSTVISFVLRTTLPASPPRRPESRRSRRRQ